MSLMERISEIIMVIFCILVKIISIFSKFKHFFYLGIYLTMVIISLNDLYLDLDLPSNDLDLDLPSDFVE